MTRTYRKVVKCGICYGSNTEYYRNMNRKCRTKNRHELRNLISNYDVDTVSEMIGRGSVPVHDSLHEPTDGTFLISKNAKKDYTYELDGSVKKDNQYGTAKNYWDHKFGKYLKSKHTNNH